MAAGDVPRTAELPQGTVTFAFTDIEGSTSLLKRLGADYAVVLSTHRRLAREAFAACSGVEIDTQGDAFFAAFARARDAVDAVTRIQQVHAEQVWPAESSVRVRIGLHTGEPTLSEEGYLGLDVVRPLGSAVPLAAVRCCCPRSRSPSSGPALPDGVGVRLVGERELKDIDEPEIVYELTIPGVTVTSAPSVPPGAPPPPPVAAGTDAARKVRRRKKPDRRCGIAVRRADGGRGARLEEAIQRRVSCLDGQVGAWSRWRRLRGRRRRGPREPRRARERRRDGHGLHQAAGQPARDPLRGDPDRRAAPARARTGSRRPGSRSRGPARLEGVRVARGGVEPPTFRSSRAQGCIRSWLKGCLCWSIPGSAVLDVDQPVQVLSGL